MVSKWAIAGLVAALAACTGQGATTGTQTSVAATASASLADCQPGTRDLSFAEHPVRVHLPPTVDAALPAVVVLHGAGDSGPSVQTQTAFDDEADRRGFMTVYPSAPSGQWALNRSGVSFLEDLAGALGCADPDRMYLAGFSRGSAMAFVVACLSQQPVYAAYGGVALADWRAVPHQRISSTCTAPRTRP